MNLLFLDGTPMVPGGDLFLNLGTVSIHKFMLSLSIKGLDPARFRVGRSRHGSSMTKEGLLGVSG